jgi:hypothetical protein
MSSKNEKLEINETVRDQDDDNHNDLKDLLHDHLTNEMFTAIQEVVYSPHIFLKFFLILFLLGAYALAAYTTIDLLLDYLTYGVTVTVRSFYETPTKFPAVTVCNLNPFTSEYGLSVLKKVNKQMQPPINIFNLNDMNKYFPNYTAKRNFIKAVFFSAMGYVVSMNDTEKKLISHQFEDTLISCQFNYAECTSNDFVWSFDPFYGNCYTFNKGWKFK